MFRYGVLTDTNEYIRVDDATGIPYRYNGKEWVEDLSLGGIYSDDIPTKPKTEAEVMSAIGANYADGR